MLLYTPKTNYTCSLFFDIYINEIGFINFSIFRGNLHFWEIIVIVQVSEHNTVISFEKFWKVNIAFLTGFRLNTGKLDLLSIYIHNLFCWLYSNNLGFEFIDSKKLGFWLVVCWTENFPYPVWASRLNFDLRGWSACNRL